MTLEIYKNYGCLATEKRIVYTYGAEQPTAVCSDKIKVKIPEGWELSKNNTGEVLVESPWGWIYNPNELLMGNKNPCFYGINKDGEQFNIKLEVVDG